MAKTPQENNRSEGLRWNALAEDIGYWRQRLIGKMWFLPAAFSLLALLIVLFAYLWARYALHEPPFTVPSNAVVSVLTILASSLLSVAVFSLSTFVNALGSASQSATPRAVPLLVADRNAQTSISIFIGAFLFSIVGILGLSAGVFSEAGRLLLFLVTLAIIVVVVMALIRWIGQISSMGLVSETIRRLEDATVSAFEAVQDDAGFGCGDRSAPKTARRIFPEAIGYVRHIAPARLQQLAEEHELTIYVLARPGAYVDGTRPVAAITGHIDEETEREIARSFDVGDTRVFNEDPRFGLIVLNEVALRALSAAINDPGTAIDVISSQVRILADRAHRMRGRAPKILRDRVHITRLSADDLVDEAFRPIAREAGGSVEVMVRLLDGLVSLAVLGDGQLDQAARRMLRETKSRALGAVQFEADRKLIEAAAHRTPDDEEQ